MPASRVLPAFFPVLVLAVSACLLQGSHANSLQHRRIHWCTFLLLRPMRSNWPQFPRGCVSAAPGPLSRSALIKRARTNADIRFKGARMSFTATGDVL